MRLPAYLLLVLPLSLGACETPASTRAAAPDAPAAPIRPVADTPANAEASTPNDQPMNAQPAAAPGPYRLLGILDPEMGNMVSFALKVPRDWQVKQSFTRRWVGAVPENQIYLSLRAPDGRAQIEYLPASQYTYADGPLAQNNRAMARSLGMPTRLADNELAPIPPVAYIRQVLLPRLAQNGLRLRDVGNEQEAPRQQEGQLTKARGSVDGTLPNGNRVRVECRTMVGAQRMNGDTYYSWSAIPSLTQSADDLAAAHAHTLVAQESIVFNPAWQQKNQELQNQGAQLNSAASRQQHQATMHQIDANTAAMQQGHQQRMDAIQQQGAANTARHNQRMDAMDQDQAAFRQRMASGDKQQEIRVDAIRGESKYEDPTTGQRVKVADGSNHVYQDRQNPTMYYGTTTPIEPGKVDWQELQKVSLQDY